MHISKTNLRNQNIYLKTHSLFKFYQYFREYVEWMRMKSVVVHHQYTVYCSTWRRNGLLYSYFLIVFTPDIEWQVRPPEEWISAFLNTPYLSRNSKVYKKLSQRRYNFMNRENGSWSFTIADHFALIKNASFHIIISHESFGILPPKCVQFVFQNGSSKRFPAITCN